ncbi:C1 family peptidase [Ideonella livida]|uniref:C1 family peptidase n=1 Tax=Ideonella livida TaxID=2707176 RepID=A0A7C9TL89_9BURK|nr:C1 family peptidase [Ideonella livida]NDY92103.1 C1 family peptidase [Ideonella livida]
MARAPQIRSATPAARPFILNCTPSREPEKDWGLATARASGVHAPAAKLPAKVDLRDDAQWPVVHQGRTGSCVGWSTADGILRWHLARAGKLGPGQRLSVRFIWMAAKETDEFRSRPTTFIEQDGTSLKAALDIARKFGCVTEEVLPFQREDGEPALFLSPVEGDPSPVDTFYAMAAQRKISAYFNLGRDLGNWRAWLAHNGPILTRLDVDPAWNDATRTQGKLRQYDAAQAGGGHCVLIVGYTRSHFIVRNSWGTEWGDRGYAYASDAYAAAAFTEAYGVAV